MVKLMTKKFQKAGRSFLLIPATLAVFTIVTFYYFRFDSNPEVKIGKFTSSKHCLQKIVDRTRQCLLNNLRSKKPEQIWLSLNTIIDKCTNFLQKTSNYIKINNKEDFKFIILPSDSVEDAEIKNQECTLLTLGIGGDIEAEKQVRNYFPNCSFIGADPSYESGRIFEDIGQFFNVAVTNQNGTVVSLVLEKQNYFHKQVQSVDFFTMLQYTNTTNIDFLFLDVEGGEYSILPLLTKKLLKNYHLCQLSLELHNFFKGEYSMTNEKFVQQIWNLLNESSYLPIFGKYVTNNKFNRMFWVDYESKYCVDKYFHDFCVFRE